MERSCAVGEGQAVNHLLTSFSYFDDEGDLIFVSVHFLHDDIYEPFTT